MFDKILDYLYRHKINEYDQKIQQLQHKLDEFCKIEVSEQSLNEIKEELKNTNKATLEAIKNYLRLDTFELVKNLAKTVNKENVSEIIAFRD